MRSVFLFLLLALPVLAQERDPTRPPVGDAASVISLDSWAQELKLTQIIYSGRNQSARLNGEWVKPGERIKGLRVTAITPNSIIVEKDSKTIEVTLFKSIKQNEKGSPGAVQ